MRQIWYKRGLLEEGREEERNLIEEIEPDKWMCRQTDRAEQRERESWGREREEVGGEGTQRTERGNSKNRERAGKVDGSFHPLHP